MSSILRYFNKLKSSVILNSYQKSDTIFSSHNRRICSKTLSPVNINHSSQDILSITFKNSTFDYPFVWLRDNCQCAGCFHPDSRSRIIDWEFFDVNVKPNTVTFNESDKNIIIKWNDDHVSKFNLKWLEERDFSIINKQKYLNEEYKPKKTTWHKGEFQNILHSFDYTEVTKDDEILKQWLLKLSTYGVAIISGVPQKPDSCRNIANRVEFIKRTHYGEEFIVQSKPDTTNVAYLSNKLQLHTDLPYYEYKPGVNLLHCVTQSLSNGGGNLLADGLFVANYLKKNDPNSYNVLSQVPVNWEDQGHEDGNKFHSLFRSPVICEDSDGEICRINHSIPQRGSHFSVPIEHVKPWYHALKKFVYLIHEHAASFKMTQGEILSFDNKRLLHGRTAYKDTLNNSRYIIGAYLDWDFIYSRIRVLNENVDNVK